MSKAYGAGRHSVAGPNQAGPHSAAGRAAAGRREFLRTLVRCLSLGGLIAGVGALATRKPGAACDRRGLCAACPSAGDCPLPEAAAHRERPTPAPSPGRPTDPTDRTDPADPAMAAAERAR